MSALYVVLLLVGCGDDAAPRSTSAGSEIHPRATPTTEVVEPEPAPPEPPTQVAIDTHVDTTQRMLDDGDDVTTSLEGGHLDFPRMREGGLNAAFFSIWVHPDRFRGDAAWERALALIGAVREVADDHPDEAALCTTADEVRAAVAAGKVAVLMGIEGAHALGSRDRTVILERLRRSFELGVRYMTLTWSNDNPLGHSSSGRSPRRGLTALGREVVREMNRLGMIVDVSHVSDRTFSDIMDITERPVLASHSSARSLSDHPRNMTDEMIRRVGEAGGAVCINYYSKFIDVEYRDRRRRLEAAHRERFRAVEEASEHWIDRGRGQLALALELDPDIAPPTLETLGDHFARVVELAGPGAACMGSDFDGVPELPLGMEDVSDLGALRAELERRGLPLGPILGDNVLRVLAAQSPP